MRMYEPCLWLFRSKHEIFDNGTHIQEFLHQTNIRHIYFLTFTHSNAQINGNLYSYDDNETLKTGLHIDKEKLTFYNPNIFIAYSIFSCLILASAFLYLILSEFKSQIA